MKKTFLKTVSVVTAAIMIIIAFAVYSTAEDVNFFSGAEGITLSTGEVNGTPFYSAIGTNAVYTSVDGENWLKRYTDSSTPLSGIDSIAYGNDIGIGVNAGEITAKYFNRDMNYDKNVYSFVEGNNGGDGYFIYLIPEVYYDSYSSLFFCHGYNSEAKDFDLYYSNGTLTQATYSGSSVDAIVWIKTEGDLLSKHSWDWNGPADDQNFTLGHLEVRPRYIMGNGNGYLVVPYGSDMNQRCAPIIGDCGCTNTDMRRYVSVIKTTEDGEVYGGHLYTTCVMMPKGAVITENGVVLVQPSADKNQRLYYADLNKVDLEQSPVVAVSSNPTALSGFDGASDKTAASFIVGNDIYFSKPATNQLYKLTVNLTDTGVDIVKHGNILETASYGISGTTGWTVKDAKVISPEKAIMLINISGAARLYELNLETYELKALSADDTYVGIEGDVSALSVTPGTYKPHGLNLQIGTDDPTTDKMVYEYVDDSGAKYFLDLDGIDVNGIFAWDDAQSGTCTFTLTARSADYPSVMKTVEITATIGE